MWHDYERLLPEYRKGTDVANVRVKRLMAGFVPCWLDNPIVEPCVDRLVLFGDASGNRYEGLVCDAVWAELWVWGGLKSCMAAVWLTAPPFA